MKVDSKDTVVHLEINIGLLRRVPLWQPAYHDASLIALFILSKSSGTSVEQILLFHWIIISQIDVANLKHLILRHLSLSLSPFCICSSTLGVSSSV